MNPIKMIASPLNDNRLLLASRNGLVELDKTNNRLYKVDDKTVLGENVSQVWDVYQDNDTLWVITSYKLFLIDLKKQKGMRILSTIFRTAETNSISTAY